MVNWFGTFVPSTKSRVQSPIKAIAGNFNFLMEHVIYIF